jgi:hypothetical protein
VSADLDALDRGVIEAGGMAAEALSRIAKLEADVAQLREHFQQMARAEQIIARAGLPPEPRMPKPRPNHLTAIEGGQP